LKEWRRPFTAGCNPGVLVAFSSVPSCSIHVEHITVTVVRGIRMITVINSLLLMLAIITVFAGIYVFRGR
jgi:hypothetical protein